MVCNFKVLLNVVMNSGFIEASIQYRDESLLRSFSPGAGETTSGRSAYTQLLIEVAPMV